MATFLLRSWRTEKGEMTCATVGKLLSLEDDGLSGSKSAHGVKSEIVVVCCFAPKGSIAVITFIDQYSASASASAAQTWKSRAYHML